MKHQLFLVFLAIAIMAGCTKDEIASYDQANPPSPLAPKPAPLGKVNPPFLVVSLQDISGTQFRIEKYRTDGSVRATVLDGYFAEDHFINDPDFSDYGEKLCYGEQQNVYLLDINTLQREVIAQVEAGKNVQSTELSPDGTMIAFLTRNADNTCDLNITGRSGESEPDKLTNADLTTLTAGPPAFSPEGNKIAYSENLNIVVSDLNGGNKIRITDGPLQKASFPIFSKDGDRLIYFQDQDHGLTLVSAEVREGAGADQVMISFLGRYSISNAAFPVLSADGSAVYFIGTSTGHTNLYRVSVAGGVPERLAFNISNSGEYKVCGLDFVGWKAE